MSERYDNTLRALEIAQEMDARGELNWGTTPTTPPGFLPPDPDRDIDVRAIYTAEALMREMDWLNHKSQAGFKSDAIRKKLAYLMVGREALDHHYAENGDGRKDKVPAYWSEVGTGLWSIMRLWDNKENVDGGKMWKNRPQQFDVAGWRETSVKELMTFMRISENKERHFMEALKRSGMMAVRTEFDAATSTTKRWLRPRVGRINDLLLRVKRLFRYEKWCRAAGKNKHFFTLHPAVVDHGIILNKYIRVKCAPNSNTVITKNKREEVSLPGARHIQPILPNTSNTDTSHPDQGFTASSEEVPGGTSFSRQAPGSTPVVPLAPLLKPADPRTPEAKGVAAILLSVFHSREFTVDNQFLIEKAMTTGPVHDRLTLEGAKRYVHARGSYSERNPVWLADTKLDRFLKNWPSIQWKVNTYLNSDKAVFAHFDMATQSDHKHVLKELQDSIKYHMHAAVNVVGLPENITCEELMHHCTFKRVFDQRPEVERWAVAVEFGLDPQAVLADRVEILRKDLFARPILYAAARKAFPLQKWAGISKHQHEQMLRRAENAHFDMAATAHLVSKKDCGFDKIEGKCRG